MNNRTFNFALLIIISCFIASCKSATSNKKDPNAIKEVIKNYKNAISNNDGNAVVNLVDQRTINWYGQSVKDAINIKRDELERLVLIRKMMVLKLRHHYSRSELENFDGKSIIIDAVENNWINQSVINDINITDVIFEDYVAKAYVSSVKDTPILHFRYQNNEWKLALWKLFYISNKYLEELVEESGMTEEEYILLLLESEATYKVDTTILNSPRD